MYKIIGKGSITAYWLPQKLDLSAEQERIAAEAWQNRPSHIFDGELFIYVNHHRTPHGIHVNGLFTNYRFYYGQQQSGNHFGVAPIGVSGLTICQDHLIFARRGPAVTDYPHYWELVPSGSIDPQHTRHKDGRVDYQSQLRQEFVEETTLPPDTIQSVTSFAFIYDPPVYDIACEIRVRAALDVVLASLSRSEEYDDPTAVPLAELDSWLTKRDRYIIPTTQGLLAAWR